MNHEILQRRKQTIKTRILLKIKFFIRLFPFNKPSIKSTAILERSGVFHFCIPVEEGIMCGDYVTLSTDKNVFLGCVDATSFNFFQERQKRDILFGVSPIGLPPIEV